MLRAMKLFALAPLALLGFLNVAQAAPSCASATTQADINACASQEYAEADQALNKSYSRYLAVLEPARKTSLRDVQRNWLKYRDSHCKFVAAAYAGGTLAPAVSSNCLAAVTKQRTEELDRLLKDRN